MKIYNFIQKQSKLLQIITTILLLTGIVCSAIGIFYRPHTHFHSGTPNSPETDDPEPTPEEPWTPRTDFWKDNPDYPKDKFINSIDDSRPINQRYKYRREVGDVSRENVVDMGDWDVSPKNLSLIWLERTKKHETNLLISVFSKYKWKKVQYSGGPVELQNEVLVFFEHPDVPIPTPFGDRLFSLFQAFGRYQQEDYFGNSTYQLYWNAINTWELGIIFNPYKIENIEIFHSYDKRTGFKKSFTVSGLTFYTNSP